MYSDRVRSRLRDIVENADWIEDDLAGIDLAAFVTDRRRADAVERCLQRITEAVIQIGDVRVIEAELDIPLAQLRSLGNRLRHEYRRIDRRVIYTIAFNDVPLLRNAAARALASP